MDAMGRNPIPKKSYKIDSRKEVITEMKMKKINFIFLALFLASLYCPAHAEPVPLPEDLNVVQPISDIPKEIASFSGVWVGGSWDGVLPHILVVERIESNGNASVIYAIGDCPEWNIRSGWIRVLGKIEKGQLEFSFQDGRTRVWYKLEGESKLIGFYETARVASFVILEKTRTLTREEILRLCQEKKMRIEAENIQIPIKTRGLFGGVKTLKLEATLYRPSREGNFPMVVFNHGSTGPGRIPATLTLKNEAQANYFIHRGYSVISPMRKGRGSSEGTYNEPYACDSASVSIGLNSAAEDLDGVFGFISDQPYVDNENILLTGVSRGGILSVYYAGNGKHRSKVKGVINFVGGWMGERCGTDLNSPVFAKAGKATKLPMLWLYSEGDSFYSPTAIKDYLKAFTKAGGNAEFKLYGSVPGDGHRLASFISAWKEAADQYLDSISFGKH